MTLHPLIGHEEARRAVAASRASGKLPSSLLIKGPRGVGKQRFALWVAQLCVCEAPAGEPCGTCRSCRLAAHLEHPDIHWYFPLPRPRSGSPERLAEALEEARHEVLESRRESPLTRATFDDVTGLYIGTVRNIRGRAHMRPTMASGPIFIIGDADLLVPQESSPEAANALLKLLEEPPGAARFLLTSSEPGRLLPTIRSRTVPLHLKPLPTEAVAEALVTYAEAEAPDARTAAALAQGSIGRAVGFLPGEDDDGKPVRGELDLVRREAFSVLRAALGSSGQAHALALSYPPAGARKLLTLFQFLEEWLRDLGAVAVGAESAVFNVDALGALRDLAHASGFAPRRIPDSLTALERARELARGNVNPQLVMGSLVRSLRAELRSAEATSAVP